MCSVDFKCTCLNGFTSQLVLRELLLRFNKIFREIISLSAVVCSFIDNISKHDPPAWDYSIQVEFNIFHITPITFTRMSAYFKRIFTFRFSFWALSYTQLKNFIWKYVFLIIQDLRSKFTTQSKVSFLLWKLARSFNWVPIVQFLNDKVEGAEVNHQFSKPVHKGFKTIISCYWVDCRARPFDFCRGYEWFQKKISCRLISRRKKIACKEIPGRNNILHCVTRIAFKDLLMGFLKIGEL